MTRQELIKLVKEVRDYARREINPKAKSAYLEAAKSIIALAGISPGELK